MHIQPLGWGSRCCLWEAEGPWQLQASERYITHPWKALSGVRDGDMTLHSSQSSFHSTQGIMCV